MFFRIPKVLVTIAIAVTVMNPTVYAECVKVTPKMWLDAPSSELVFAGTLVELAATGESGSKATFEVERVWRGRVTKRFDGRVQLRHRLFSANLIALMTSPLASRPSSLRFTRSVTNGMSPVRDRSRQTP